MSSELPPRAHGEALALDGFPPRLGERTPQEILSWAASRFEPRLAFATGFGREGGVLLHMIATARLPVSVFTLDTGLLFTETYALWRAYETALGIQIRGVVPGQTLADQAAEHGENLWERDPDRCCELRKVVPLRQELASHFAWITAIRREQSSDRAAAGTVEFDEKFGLVKVNPLLNWTGRDVDAYIQAHGIPTNPLHEKGYESVGCWPCTTPVSPGEDPRAGRWRGTGKTECGLHKRPSLTKTERKESNV